MSVEDYSVPPFRFAIKRDRERLNYEVVLALSPRELALLREAVAEMSRSFKVSSVVPLTFPGWWRC